MGWFPRGTNLSFKIGQLLALENKPTFLPILANCTFLGEKPTLADSLRGHDSARKKCGNQHVRNGVRRFERVKIDNFFFVVVWGSKPQMADRVGMR
jgi:hypothetical protein